jgi:prepilin-type N-terminal cleavage/methylation domain-containing protein
MKPRTKKAQQRRAGRSGNRNDDQRGFTLLETSIALLIMVVAGLAVASLFTFAIAYNSGAGDRAAAIAIAQQYTERLRKTPLASITTPSSPDTVTRVGRSYSVQTTICTTSDCGGSPTLEVITVQVTPQAGSAQWANTPVVVKSQRATPVLGSYFQ